MTEKPKRNELIKSIGVDGYIDELRLYINNNKEDKLAKIDLYKILLKTGEYKEFEILYHELRKSNPIPIVYREFGRYLLFAKFDYQRAKKVLRKAIEVNKNEPAWVYYFAGLEYTYYEKMCDGLLYTAIPKNASTSLKSFILDSVLKQSDSNPHSVFGNPFFKTLHYTDKEIANSTKVLVLREPSARFYSYFNKNVKEEDSLAYEYNVDSKIQAELFNLKLQPTIEEFVGNFWNYCLVFNDVLHHTLPQAAYIGSLNKYDYICDISEVDDLVKFVANKLDVKGIEKAPKKMIPKKKKKTVNEEDKIKDFISLIYDYDYKLISRNLNILNPKISTYFENPNKYADEMSKINFTKRTITHD